MNTNMRLYAALLVLILIGGGYVAWRSGGAPEPEYVLISDSDGVQVRKYCPIVCAQVYEKGDQQDALQKGFSKLAKYISGDNTLRNQTDEAKQSVTLPMMSPVTQHRESGKWCVRFVMPPEETFISLPYPHNKDIEVVALPGRVCAVVQFSGYADAQTCVTHVKRLKAYLKTHGMAVKSAPVLAFYNAPWVPGFLRRNEVMIEVE